MNPASLLMGLTAFTLAGAAGFLWWRSRGDVVILYSVNAPEAGHVRTFTEVAGRAGQLFGVSPVPVANGQNVLDAIRQHTKIKTLLLIGHGTSTAFIRPGSAGIRVGTSALPAWLGLDEFARVLAPRLASGFWLGLLGCRAAAESSEADWTPVTAGVGGARSLAGQLRDLLVQRGAPRGVVGGHTTTGATDANPRAREFVVDSSYVGRPGLPVTGISQGATAVRWAFTGRN